nr:low molecular weight phosphotyrosine protein phosphatase [Bacteroidota bacterium]
MVCLGNICRSPLAEGILRSKLQKSEFKAMVDSAGTSSYHVGEMADPRSIEVARKFGIDITDHRSRQITRRDFDQFDLIYAMDNSNFRNICNLARNESDLAKVRLFLDVIEPGGMLEVPDPYYSGKDGFVNVFRLIEKASDAIVDELENNIIK